MTVISILWFFSSLFSIFIFLSLFIFFHFFLFVFLFLFFPFTLCYFLAHIISISSSKTHFSLFLFFMVFLVLLFFSFSFSSSSPFSFLTSQIKLTHFSQLKISIFFLFLSQHSFSNLDPLFPCFNHPLYASILGCVTSILNIVVHFGQSYFCWSFCTSFAMASKGYNVFFLTCGAHTREKNNVLFNIYNRCVREKKVSLNYSKNT